MEKHYEAFRRRLAHTQTDFVRSIMDSAPWDARLLGIRGPRGIGKTTLLLQHIKLKRADCLDQTLYVSLDSVWFRPGMLAELVAFFTARGGRYLYLDEVHKYPNWAQELKNAYDEYPELQVVFTGSSALEILNSRADLSRRALVIEMQGFSFREFLNIELGRNLPPVSLEDVLTHHLEISAELIQRVKPLAHFDRYVNSGYYPFYRESEAWYPQRLTEVVNMILEVELPQLRGTEIGHVAKLRTLLGILGDSAPFTPNVSTLAQKAGIGRNFMLNHLHYLNDVGLTRNVFRAGQGISLLQKPQKILLDNPNLFGILASNQPDRGSIRETFFANQVGFKYDLSYPEVGDFAVENHLLFEVGGRSKTLKQIQKIPHSYIAADGIEMGLDRKIPLWLFGFLY